MIRALFAASLILSFGNHAFALGYKEAKAECLKEKPDLKGKVLRSCIKDKEAAAKGQTDGAKGSKAATDATDTESTPN